MGWNFIKKLKECSLLKEVDETFRFYFVHSYHVTCKNPDDALALTHYGHEFTSIFQNGNIAGVQFHPEKSHKFGMRILKNFVEYGL